ncbi:hypothetical protein [Streptomyces microflavus]|uniref:hypothetical protein n=1 Tax=Streptomyces microflavus TaxID=1919 RepID=UPI0038267FCE
MRTTRRAARAAVRRHSVRRGCIHALLDDAVNPAEAIAVHSPKAAGFDAYGRKKLT